MNTLDWEKLIKVCNFAVNKNNICQTTNSQDRLMNTHNRSTQNESQTAVSMKKCSKVLQNEPLEAETVQTKRKHTL